MIKFALELEEQSMGFYDKALDLVSTDELESLYSTLRDKCKIRIGTLKRIRRENVTEMILEPISGLDSKSYSLKLDVPISTDAISASAIAIEETRKEFYERGSLKIEFLIEAATEFDRLADENQDNIDTIRLTL